MFLGKKNNGRVKYAPVARKLVKFSKALDDTLKRIQSWNYFYRCMKLKKDDICHPILKCVSSPSNIFQDFYSALRSLREDPA